MVKRWEIACFGRYIRRCLLCFPMKYFRFSMFLRAAHASLPVPSARSAELHCRVDVSGCEWLQIVENPGHSGRVLFFDYFQFQFEIGSINSFIRFQFQFEINFYSFAKLDRGPPRTMGIVHFHKVFKGFWLLMLLMLY